MLQNTRANQIRVWTADSAVRKDLTTDANACVTTSAISVNMVFIGFDVSAKKVNHNQIIKNRINGYQWGEIYSSN